MTGNDAREAARLLRAHWMVGTRLAALPDRFRPANRSEGYAIQAQLGDESDLYGWKIAATSVAGQQHINVGGPIAGRMFADTIVPDGGACSLAANAFRLAEPEFAFRMARDLPPRETPYTVDEVLAAVATLHPAIELPDSRYENVVEAGEAQIIADNACAHRFVLGPATSAPWRDIDLVASKVIARVGMRYTREGVGAAVLGDPRVALAWLANELRALDLTLRAGMVVTTGTCCAPLDLIPGDALSVDFGPLGRVSLTLTA